jgi:hypothetical protein
MAIETRAVVVAPFQICTLPQTKLMAVFQPQTAAGKLKAVINPNIPNGCHISIMTCPGPVSKQKKTKKKTRFSIFFSFFHDERDRRSKEGRNEENVRSEGMTEPPMILREEKKK